MCMFVLSDEEHEIGSWCKDGVYECVIVKNGEI